MDASNSVEGTPAGTDVLEAPTCQHQWIIDSPAGPSSKGVCRACGEEREFLNYIEGSSWGYDVSLEQLAGGSRFPVTTQAQRHGGLDEDEETS